MKATVFDRFQTLLGERSAEAARRSAAKLAPAAPEPEGRAEAAADRPLSSQDWDALIDQVQSTAEHIRDAAQRLHAREARFEALLARAEEEMCACAERLREVEDRARGAEIRAERATAEAHAQAQAAEARSRTLETVLDRMRQLVLSGCDAAAEVEPPARPVMSLRRVA